MTRKSVRSLARKLERYSWWMLPESQGGRVHYRVLDTLHKTEEVMKLLYDLDTSKTMEPDNHGS